MCKEMLTNIENKWSKQKLCLSKANVFVNIFIDKENLQTAIRNLSYTSVFKPRYANKSMPHPAYCQYMMGELWPCWSKASSGYPIMLCIRNM